MEGWETGHVKQALIHRALALRRALPAVFAHGTYHKLEAEGPAAAHVLAFMRSHKNQHVVVAVTRLPATLPTAHAWGETKLIIPSVAWTDALQGGAVAAPPVGMALTFENLPVALLRSI